MEQHDALVLDLDTRAGLAITRSLGRAGLTLGIATQDGRASGARTRYAARRLVLPPAAASLTAYGDALAAYLHDQPTDAVLCSVDASLETLHRRRDEIGRLAAPAVAGRDAVEMALSKSRTLAIAAELGIAAPRSIRVADRPELEAGLASVDLPAVLKPDESWLDRGDGGERVSPLWLATREHAERAAERLLRDGGTALLQEVAPGARETVKLFRHDGRWLARLVMTSSRTWPPLGGSSVMRWTAAPSQDVLEPAERLVAAIGLDGYAEVEFRRSADGTPLLMEVNPRLSQSVEVALRAGVDFPRMQLEWARGGRLEPVSRYPVGVRVGWLAGDARLLVAAIARRGPQPRPRLAATAAEVARDYVLRRARPDGFDLRDPRPLVGALAFSVRGAAAASRSP